MDHRPYIAKHLKGSLFEQEVSVLLHCQGIACLISPLFLRRYGAGQVDLALYHRQTHSYYLYELKSYSLELSYSQRTRLRQSMALLAHFLQKPVILKLCTKNSLQKNGLLLS